MVKKVEPKVFLLGGSSLDKGAVDAYLEHMGVKAWEPEARSYQEELTELYSRSCYRSFEVGLNPNVTRVRGSNQEHLENILKVGHTSVMEHAITHWMFCNVSRVFTHELVRHRVGVAISQESLRYVRLEDLSQWIPPCFADLPEAEIAFKGLFRECERVYGNLLRMAAVKEGVDSFDQLDFGRKKVYTSAARRVAPIGLATNIGWSSNITELRHVIQMRTDPSAEEEMRLVFGTVGGLAKAVFPNLFQDMEGTEDGPFTIWKIGVGNG